MRSASYYANARPEVLRWVEKQPEAVILDVGCGTGATLALLKERGHCAVAVGVEMSPQCEKDARVAVDEFHAKRVEEVEFASERFDWVLLLDVLEHLADTEETLMRIRGWLKPGGRLLVSVPNVRNQAVLRDLILHGRWDYTDSGILDRTHLRFFTRGSARALFDRCGFVVLHEDANYDGGLSGAILRALPIVREFAACQLLFVLRVGGTRPAAASFP